MSLMMRRNLMAEKMPFDYRVEYIRPNGVSIAYVDTGIVFDINTDVEIKGKILNPSATWNIFYWARSGTNSYNSSMCVLTGNSTGRFAKVASATTSDVHNINYDPESFSFSTSGRKFFIGDNDYYFKNSDGDSSVNKTLLFVLNQANGVSPTLTDSGTCISSMKITKGGVLLRDMISVVANGLPTLCDFVSGENMPTFGELIAGQRI